jgi:hypothetical protein
MALLREEYKSANRMEKFFPESSSRYGTVFGDVFPDFRDVPRSGRVENESFSVVHQGERRFNNSSSRSRRSSKNSSPAIGFTRPLRTSS